MQTTDRAPRRFSRLGVSTWIGAAVAFGSFVLVAIHLDLGLKAVEDASEDAITLGHVSSRLQLLDEELSMAARMAAATGDPRWEAVYRAHEPELEALIELARSRRVDGYGFRMVREAGDLVVALEERALDAAREGRLDDASELLQGEMYRRERRRYAHGLALAATALEASAAESLAQTRRGLMVEAGFGALVVMCLLITWFTAARRWRMVAQREVEALDAAYKSERAKDELVSNVSHEMRTPLNGILGAADLLLASEQTEEHEDLTETIRESGLALIEVVDDLLDFARVECGEIELVEGDVDLRRVLSGVQDVYGRRGRLKGVDLTAMVEPAVPRLLLGDSVRYRQVLVQLVSNAVKFTDDGEVAIRVELDSQRSGEVTVRTHVKDTGIGIEPEVLPGLFGPFGQADPTTTRPHGGTGLGLALAHKLTTLLGGEIQVRSEPGAGSTFTFTCRLRTQAKRQPEPAQLAGQRALVVDDGSPNMRAVWELLLSWGAHTEKVDDPAEARAAIDRARSSGSPFRFVLFDLSHVDAGLSDLLESLVESDALGFQEPGAIPPTHHVRLELLERPVRQSDLHDRIQERLGLGDWSCESELAERGKGARILLVEDNPVNQKIACRALEGLGCQVEVAAHGGEAIQHFRRRRFDVVFMDCQMPEIDGYEATRQLRRIEGGRRHTPVIALTANALAGDREKCLTAGMDDFLTKPADRGVLAEALERWTGAGVERS